MLLDKEDLEEAERAVSRVILRLRDDRRLFVYVQIDPALVKIAVLDTIRSLVGDVELIGE